MGFFLFNSKRTEVRTKSQAYSWQWQMVPTLHSYFLCLLATYYTLKDERQIQKAVVSEEDNEATQT